METKRPLSPIQNETVRLRQLADADLPLTLAWRNQPEIRRWFFHSEELTWEQHRGWFEKYAVRDDDFVFIIEDGHTGQPIGQVALYHIDWEARRCEYGRLMMGEGAARGKGYAKAATRLVCQLGFETLGLDEIYLEVFEHNAAARAVYTACGFQLDRLQDGVAYMILQRGHQVV
jgi:diamine N-acetyltransferase